MIIRYRIALADQLVHVPERASMEEELHAVLAEVDEELGPVAVPSVQPDAQGHAPAAEGPIVVDRLYKGQQSQASIERAAARRRAALR
jgi:hypothetical protein